MSYTKLGFGKYRGLTLPQIIFKDPDWFFWAWEQRVLERNGLRSEANELYRKACRIKIPGNPEAGLQLQLFIHPHSYAACGLEIVPADDPVHPGAHRSDYFDLGLVREVKLYDKTGSRAFVRELKDSYFGDDRYRMTRRRCEDFFDNPDNFDL